jgi:ribose transport system substrate-binding protein
MPKLRAMITLDVIDTRAASFAVIGSHARERIILIGCDQDLDLVRQLRMGNIDALVAQNTFVMGYDAVQLIASEHKGEPTEAKRVVLPILVTRDNVDQPEVQQVLDMNWRAY